LDAPAKALKKDKPAEKRPASVSTGLKVVKMPDRAASPPAPPASSVASVAPVAAPATSERASGGGGSTSQPLPLAPSARASGLAAGGGSYVPPHLRKAAPSAAASESTDSW